MVAALARCPRVGTCDDARKADTPMRPMQEFDPKRPSRVHDWLTNSTLEWRPARADEWYAFAQFEENGFAYFDGLILDGWELRAER
jgi:hypothetical protein